MNSVTIILSTYNGSKYLVEQLDSLLAQTYENFTIWVRDDGSADSTKEIIENYKTKYPAKFNLIDWDTSHNMGFGASFLRILEVAQGELYFFCDQDDIWEINKLEVMANYYQSHSDKSIPYLLHSDMSYIGEESLKETSFFELTSYVPEREGKFLFRGFIPGCSMALNQSLKNLCIGLDYKSSHDFLTYCLAKVYGSVVLIEQPLFRYRLHDKNTVGLGKSTPTIILIKDFLKYFFKSRTYRSILLENYYNLASAITTYDRRVKELEIYTEKELDDLGFWQRKKWYIKHFHPFYPNSFEGLLKTLTF